MALLALLTTLSLAAAACSSPDPPPAPPPAAGEEGDTGSPGAPPAPGEDSPGSTESPSSTGTDGSEGDAEEGPAPPEPGQPTGAAFQVEGRGTEPVDDAFVPVLTLARNLEEAERAVSRSPISGPVALLKGWSDYGNRSLVVFLGGSQPDPSHRVRIKDLDVIRSGSTLLAFGRVDRRGEAAAGVISMPWIIVSVDADATGVVSRCILALEGQVARTTSCP